VNDLLAEFAVTVEIPVAWGEMDAYGHVNNIVYFRYFETARMACFERVGLGELMERKRIGPILHSTSCRFRIPLTYPDTVTVGAHIRDIGIDRFSMRYRVVSHDHGRVAADGDGLIVMFDYAAKSKTSVPDELRRRIAEVFGRAS
jgi:acyl-CoA thioester hydrolase